jgi:ribosome maturation factor RimP
LRKRASARFLYFKRGNEQVVRKHKKKLKANNSIPAGKFISNIVSRVMDLAEPVCESEGMELILVEYGPEKGGKTLRLYIDKPGGITLDDCTFISHQVGDILDVNLEGSGSYNLEVSSPGPERPLAKIDDFERFEGNIIKIKTSRPIDGQKNFKGILSGISGGVVTLTIENKTVAIPYQDVIRARLVKPPELKGGASR